MGRLSDRFEKAMGVKPVPMQVAASEKAKRAAEQIARRGEKGKR